MCAKLVIHQLLAIGELQRKPVPPILVSGECTCAPLAIEPTVATDFAHSCTASYLACARHTREAVIVRSIACSRTFLAQAIFALQHRRFAAREFELKCKAC